MNGNNVADVLREALGNIATWRGQLVMMYVDLTALTAEQYMASIINDVALLKYAGIDVIFSCSGDGAEKFVQRASQRNINVRVLARIDDIENVVEDLNVAKLFFLCEGDGVFGHEGLVSEFTAQEGVQALEGGLLSGAIQHRVRVAVELCVKGVKRVHFVNAKRAGALLEEFLTDKGCGTMVYGNVPPYKLIRKATPSDVITVTSIIRETVDPAVSEDVMMCRLSDMTIFSVDDNAHAATITAFIDGECLIEYLVHSSEFKSHEALDRLLDTVEAEAINSGTSVILIDPNRAPELIGIQPWFLRRGYVRNISKQKRSHHKWWKKVLSN